MQSNNVFYDAVMNLLGLVPLHPTLLTLPAFGRIRTIILPTLGCYARRVRIVLSAIIMIVFACLIPEFVISLWMYYYVRRLCIIFIIMHEYWLVN